MIKSRYKTILRTRDKKFSENLKDFVECEEQGNLSVWVEFDVLKGE